MKKFALVLSGGGFKGAFQMGALRHLRKNWSAVSQQSGEMKFDVVAGVSVGSLNGVLAASREFDALERLWLEIGPNVGKVYTSGFIDTTSQTDKLKLNLNLREIKNKFIPNVDLRMSLWKALGLLISRSERGKYIDELLQRIEKDFAANFQHFRSIADNAPLRDRLNELVSLDKIRDCIFKCGFVSLNDGVYYSFRSRDFKSDPNFRNAILASTAMPIVWEPVEKISVFPEGKEVNISQSVDGGIRNVSPLADVIDEINNDEPGHDYTIIIINCSSGDIDYEDYQKSNIAGIALRALNDIAIAEIFNNDISEFLRINDILEQVGVVNPGMQVYNYNPRLGRTGKILRPFRAIVIQPDGGVLGDSLVANGPLNERRILHGEKKAAQALRDREQHQSRPVVA
ncbi:MAG TPA: patatin-like phospholipase family protein [Chryseosolibacter sp.]